MQEQNIVVSQILLKNKKEIPHTLGAIESKTTINIQVGLTTIEVRPTTLKELLDKELNYNNRMLKSFGVTELT